MNLIDSGLDEKSAIEKSLLQYFSSIKRYLYGEPLVDKSTKERFGT